MAVSAAQVVRFPFRGAILVKLGRYTVVGHVIHFLVKARVDVHSLQPASPVYEVRGYGVWTLGRDASRLIVEPCDAHDHGGEDEKFADENAWDLVEDAVVALLDFDADELVDGVSEIETHFGVWFKLLFVYLFTYLNYLCICLLILIICVFVTRYVVIYCCLLFNFHFASFTFASLESNVNNCSFSKIPFRKKFREMTHSFWIVSFSYFCIIYEALVNGRQNSLCIFHVSTTL